MTGIQAHRRPQRQRISNRGWASAVLMVTIAVLLAGCANSKGRPGGLGGLVTTSTASSTTTTSTSSTTLPPPTTATSVASTTTTPPASGLVMTGHGWSSSGLEGPMPAAGTCHYRTATDGYALPDPACTPGAVDTAVTQNDIGSTICSSGYTSSVRPPESITEPAKYQSMYAYDSSGSAGSYEYDHLVPLELGGSSDVRNLWPEPNVGSPSQFDSTDSYGINAKDGVEDRLNSAVCDGQVNLVAAQRAIAANWTTAESVLGVSP
ncbi:MAG: hypothetical protein ACYDD4_03440 [Acidimicrobiales bacterium]